MFPLTFSNIITPLVRSDQLFKPLGNLDRRRTKSWLKPAGKRQPQMIVHIHQQEKTNSDSDVYGRRELAIMRTGCSDLLVPMRTSWALYSNFWFITGLTNKFNSKNSILCAPGFGKASRLDLVQQQVKGIVRNKIFDKTRALSKRIPSMVKTRYV